jgi:hypothetical protein
VSFRFDLEIEVLVIFVIVVCDGGFPLRVVFLRGRETEESGPKVWDTALDEALGGFEIVE